MPAPAALSQALRCRMIRRTSRHSASLWVGMPRSAISEMPEIRVFERLPTPAISPALCPRSTSLAIRISARVMMRKQSACVSLAAPGTPEVCDTAAHPASAPGAPFLSAKPFWNFCHGGKNSVDVDAGACRVIWERFRRFALSEFPIVSSKWTGFAQRPRGINLHIEAETPAARLTR
jgi:hypothetical protein